MLAGERFEDDQAQRVDVGGGQWRLPPHLFGREVGGGADDGAR